MALPSLMRADYLDSKPLTLVDLADNHESDDVSQPPSFGFRPTPTPHHKSAAQLKFSRAKLRKPFNDHAALCPREASVRFYVRVYRGFNLFVVHTFCSTQRSGSRPRQLPLPRGEQRVCNRPAGSRGTGCKERSG